MKPATHDTVRLENRKMINKNIVRMPEEMNSRIKLNKINNLITVQNKLHDKHVQEKRDSIQKTDLNQTIHINQELMEFNSMKFSKPRLLSENPFPPTKLNDFQLARIWTQRSLGFDQYYNNYIDKIVNSLLDEKKESARDKRKAKLESNLVEPELTRPQYLSFIDVSFHNSNNILAMLDSGATTNLILGKLLDKWNIKYKKQKVNLNTAQGTATNLVDGTIRLPITFTSSTGEKVKRTLFFLVANSLNGHQCILDNSLVNGNIWNGINKTFILHDKGKAYDLNVYQKSTNEDENYVYTSKSDTVIQPSTEINLCCNLIVKNDFKKYISTLINPSNIEKIILPSAHIKDGTNGILYNKNIKLFTHNNISIESRTFNVQKDTFITTIKNNNDKTITIPANQPLGTALLRKQGPPAPMPQPEKVPEVNIIKKQQNTFKGLNNSQPESLEDLMDHSDFVPLEEFRKVHKLSDIDYSMCPDQLVQKAKLISKKYEAAFSRSKLDIGKASELTSVYMPIDTIKGKVSQDKKRVLSGTQLIYANKVIDEYIRLGLMEENSNSEFRTNINLVKKKSDSLQTFSKADFKTTEDVTNLRATFDVRTLNNITTETRPTTLISIDQLHAKLKNKFVILTDINNFFTHIAIKKNHAHKTSFYLNERIIRAKFALQGLKQAPFYGQKLLTVAYSQERFERALTQVDEQTRKLTKHIKLEDVLIWYCDDGYLFHEDPIILLALWELFLICSINAGLKMCPGKTQIITTEFNCLGIKINTKTGTKTLDQQKIQALITAKVPNSLFELHSRLAQLNYISKFVYLLQIYTYPLSLLLKRKQFIWTIIEQEAWEMLLLVLRLNTRLVIPEIHENLVITTDGSRFALGASLFVDRNNNLELCQVSSKINSLTNYHKSSYCLELMSLHFALATFWPILVSCRAKIYIFSDARCILYLKRMSSHSLLVQNLLDSIVHKFSQLNVIFSHIPGSLNLLSDALSRSFDSHFKEIDRHPLSKIQALKLPPLPKNFTLDSNNLLHYLTSRLEPEFGDIYAKNASHSSPPKIIDIYKNLPLPTPETRYYTVLKLLAGNNHSDTNPSHFNVAITETEKSIKEIYIKKIDKLLDTHFEELKNTPQYTQLRQSLYESYQLILKNEHNFEQDRQNKIDNNLHQINLMIDTIQSEFDKKYPKQQSLKETAISATEAELKKDYIHSNPIPAVNSTVAVWTTTSNPSIDYDDDSIHIHFKKELCIPANKEIQLGIPVVIDPQSQNIKQSLLHHNIKHATINLDYYDLKTMSLHISIHNNTHKTMSISTIHLTIQLLGQPNNTFDFHNINSRQVHPIHILSKIQSPTKIFSFPLNTYISIHNTQLSAETNKTDLRNGLNVAQDAINNVISNKSNKNSYLESASSDTQYHDVITPEQTDFDKKFEQLIIETDIRNAGSITKSTFIDLQDKDPYCISQLTNKKSQTNKSEFKIINKILFRLHNDKQQLVVPAIVGHGLLQQLHIIHFHPSDRELKKVTSNIYFFPHFQTMATKIRQACYICTVSKNSNIGKVNKTPVKRRIDSYSTQARQCLSIDIIYLENLQYAYTLIIMDMFSGFLYAQPLKTKSSTETAAALLQYFIIYDFPAAILSDKGTEFEGEVQQLFMKHSILHFQSHAYAQHQNNVEASIKLLKNFLRITIHTLNGSKAKETYFKYIQLSVSYINKKRLKTIGYSRFQLFFGSNPINNNHIFQDLDNTDNNEKQIYNFLSQRDDLITTCRKMRLESLAEKSEGTVTNNFKENDVVFLKNHVKTTLNDIYTGPYKILEIHHQGAKLICLKTKNVQNQHVKYLKHFNLDLYSQNFPKNVVDNFALLAARMPLEKSTKIGNKILEPSSIVTRALKKNSKESLNNISLHNLTCLTARPHKNCKTAPSAPLLQHSAVQSIDVCNKKQNALYLPPGKNNSMITLSLKKLAPIDGAKVTFKYVHVKYFE